MDSLTFSLNLSLVAPRGRVDGPFPFSGETRYANAAPINAVCLKLPLVPGQTGSNPAAQVDSMIDLIPIVVKLVGAQLMDRFPMKELFITQTQTRQKTSGNPRSIPSGVVPEVISYGYGGYPLGNMDVAESNTTASGRVDGPVPYGGATHHTNANPVKKDSQSGNLGSIPSGVAPEVISYGYGGDRFANMALQTVTPLPQDVLMDLFLMALRLVMPTQNLCQKTSNKTI
ncbi:hypothetical protein F7725_013658 [Dissostichus mawsoni]|uniref:Uncharacterized protein n=1 Tax=Dissostichus mawsoni TaxID=36200 RepID=A0A7J5YU43_DISMA|nr:hypothetical protein F7725_013658 [Dissostichus mawsoni]